MPPAPFEPATLPSKLPQTYALDIAVTGIGRFFHIPVQNSKENTLLVTVK
jgi:hypothetical protein